MLLPAKLPHRVIVLCASLCALAVSVSAQQKVNWSAKLEPAQVKPGQKAKLLITASIESGWHLYSLTQPAGGPRPTLVTLDENPVFALDGEVKQPKPKVAFDPNFQINTETFDGTVTFTAPVKVAADAPPGAQKLVAKVRFQVCDEHQCLPPRTKPIEIDVMIAAANAPAALAAASPTAAPKASPSASPSAKASPSASVSPSPSATASASPAPDAADSPTAAGATGGDSSGGPSGLALPQGGTAAQTPARNAAASLQANGLLGYIWLALGFGFLALLTPCVFPMIPITVSFFTKREHQTRGQAVKQALVYCLGIIFTFTGLGLAMTLIAGPAGINKLAANPWMNLFLTTLFVVFALNLFGLFEIRLPSGLLSKLDARAGSGTMAATLLMGLTFTLTSFTCTAAFVGTVLVAATQGQWFWSAVGMLAFSTAFALPFFLLAVFPHWLKSLPSSGGWLNSVKVVMGFIELAAAFKFLSNVDLVWEWNTVSRSVVLAGWIAIALVTTVYLLGKFQLPHDTPMKHLGVVRMLAATFFLGMAFYFLTGLFGARLGEWEALLPPAQLPGSSPSVGFVTAAGPNAGHAKWLESYDAALARAKAENKPVFVNFTGVTCTNCRWMETNIIADSEVQRVLGDFVLAELYTDRDRPEDEYHGKLQEEKFGTVALPLYVVVDHNGNELSQQAGLTRDKDEFIRFLRTGADKFGQLAKK
jgi:thiol:disulfide interchange protein